MSYRIAGWRWWWRTRRRDGVSGSGYRRTLPGVTMQATGTRADVPAGDLLLLATLFGLGEISDVRFVAEGLMNRNWRITAGRGVFALKQIIDVPLPAARRNLAVVRALAGDGVPACPPVVTAGGDTVAESAGRGYCVFPWVDGCHRHGTELTLGQARSLGVVLGRIHQSLNRLASGAGRPDKPACPGSRCWGHWLRPTGSWLALPVSAPRSRGTWRWRTAWSARFCWESTRRCALRVTGLRGRPAGLTVIFSTST